MATIKKPKLLLLDEHTAALDPNTSHQLLELTNQVVQKDHLTCVMITHQLKDALKYGNRIVILNNGKIVLDVCGEEKEQINGKGYTSILHRLKNTLSKNKFRKACFRLAFNNICYII